MTSRVMNLFHIWKITILKLKKKSKPFVGATHFLLLNPILSWFTARAFTPELAPGGIIRWLKMNQIFGMLSSEMEKLALSIVTSFD
jgi:hypothetical protein